ncbi:phosphoserine phosphatase SerB [Kribbella sandramycini]|uniref:phosphoserine phosphatase n=1 Tax=Kribbella sandramycini TaxID=60450 RepID=A0A7Y4KYR8_9ACTN|nr:phosphoserine phosphatase SerB [Kribbella sandramycini]MBB6568988.1 phosphoserine phosphatase [Kribbella sandramycini]NOL41167.1 phosphoserine phosphatase SerB [Kribbella sandramycini]
MTAQHEFETQSADRPTLLVTLTGTDRPGLTSAVLSTLATRGLEVIDAEQVVLRGRLILGVLLSAPRDHKNLKEELKDLASALDIDISVKKGVGDNEPRRKGRSQVTVIGHPLTAVGLAAIAGRIADTGANIDRISRMARYPVTAMEIAVSGVEPETLRTVLALEGVRQGLDVAVQDGGLYRRAKRLIVMDVDSTLIQGEVIEMLAGHAGRLEEVAAVTEAAMRGELDFAASLEHRVKALAGLPASALDAVYEAIEFAPGARTLVRTLKRLGYQFAIVSGGFSQITDRLAADLGIDYAKANELEIVNGVLTGRVIGEIVDRPGKAVALRQFAQRSGTPLSQTVAIGDGANDLDMLAAAGLGVAFNAKPVVREAADTHLSVPYLDTILYLLGISREEVETADADTPA